MKRLLIYLLQRDTVVATTGNLYTGTIGTGFQSGYYTSGNIYNYKLVPFDFVGSGEVLSFDLEQSVRCYESNKARHRHHYC